MNALDFLPPRSPIEAEMGTLWQAHRAGRHEEVVRGAEAHLADLPENRDLLLLLATGQRHLGRIDDALATLDRLAGHHPGYSRLHEERGLCHVARKDAPAAIGALMQAVGINAALPMSWRMLEGLYRLTRDTDNAAIAATHVRTLAAQPPEVIAATALFADGDLGPAEEIIRAFLLAHGDEPEAMRLLARIGMAREVLDDAETLLAAVLEIAPDYQAARLDYAQVLAQRQKFMEARAELDRLLASGFGGDHRALEAQIAIGLGDQESAIALYRSILVDYPGLPDVQLWLGHALKTVGKVPEAITAYRGAAAAKPDFGDAYWSLANLKLYRFEDGEIDAMREQEAAPDIAPIDRVHLCFALGKALEDRKDFAESWTYYARGNAIQREESRYRPEVIETNTARQKSVCTPAFFAKRAGWGVPDRDPIFILGLPRSGSTLIEQILASHSQVEGTQELPDIQRFVQEMQGRDPDLDDPLYPGAMAEMTRADFEALGRRYLEQTRAYRSDRPFFIDKMPNNFRHIGLIHLMLPNATIIDTRREPMACCFSNLKQLFAQGQEFTYSAEDIARYYRTYLDLMAHWDVALPGRVLRVQHEDVIDDLEGSVRRILDHCGLPFEESCVEFHKNRRAVRTPSSEQVRRPIFRDSMEQWRSYEPWLGDLKAALGDLIRD